MMSCHLIIRGKAVKCNKLCRPEKSYTREKRKMREIGILTIFQARSGGLNSSHIKKQLVISHPLQNFNYFNFESNYFGQKIKNKRDILKNVISDHFKAIFGNRWLKRRKDLNAIAKFAFSVKKYTGITHQKVFQEILPKNFPIAWTLKCRKILESFERTKEEPPYPACSACRK